MGDHVVPAKAGTSGNQALLSAEVPAFAGMTAVEGAAS